MKPKPLDTLEATKLFAVYGGQIAEAIGLIAIAIAKHSPDPEALLEDLRNISAPDPSHTPPMAMFFRGFHSSVSLGEGIDPH